MTPGRSAMNSLVSAMLAWNFAMAVLEFPIVSSGAIALCGAVNDILPKYVGSEFAMDC